ncbi:MAG: phage tail protein, partial [Myxococcales bacterium]|nr:phage tail protein [Myxococcales bacterium]
MSTEFPINIERISPYKNFKFLVHWDGKPVAGVSKISGLKRTTEIVSHRDGGDVSSQRLSPGLSKFTALTLERGITYDPEFEAWANKVHSQEGAGAVSLAGFRKNLRIELL